MTITKIQSKEMLAYGAKVIATVLLMRAAVSSEVLSQIAAANTLSENAITLTSANPNASLISNIAGSIPLRSIVSEAIHSKVKSQFE
jgi:hypothetical protein